MSLPFFAFSIGEFHLVASFEHALGGLQNVFDNNGTIVEIKTPNGPPVFAVVPNGTTLNIVQDATESVMEILNNAYKTDLPN